jgi:hypothetical protein
MIKVGGEDEEYSGSARPGKEQTALFGHTKENHPKPL